MDHEIMKEYKPPKHCGSYARLVFHIYDGGWGDSGAYLFWQCDECGMVLKTRIKDSRHND
jgi:hypothetical protein